MRRRAGRSLLVTLGLLLAACSPATDADPPAEGGPAGPVAGPVAGSTASTLEQVTEPRPECDTYTPVGVARVPEVVARVAPRDDAAVVATFAKINGQGAQQVFPILAERYAHERLWHEVMLPVRPNGTTGWILASAVSLRRSDYRIEVDLERFRLDLFERCERLARYPIGIGTRDTPTPRGTFFLNSLLKPPEPGTVYGALAFGLSAYSDVITDWEGGGIVGLHGTNDPSSLGRRTSYGCIRMENRAIRDLARKVPLGTPIEIS